MRVVARVDLVDAGNGVWYVHGATDTGFQVWTVIFYGQDAGAKARVYAEQEQAKL